MKDPKVSTSRKGSIDTVIKKIHSVNVEEIENVNQEKIHMRAFSAPRPAYRSSNPLSTN